METICRHGEGPNCPDCYVYELDDLRKLLTHPNTPHILGKMLRDGLIRRVDISLRKLKEAEINEVNLTEPHRAFRPSVEPNPEPVIPRQPPFQSRPYQAASTPPLPADPPEPPSTPPRPKTEFVILSPHPTAYMSPVHETVHYADPSPFHYARHSLTAPRYSTTRSPQYSPYSPYAPRHSMPHHRAVHYLPPDDSDEIFFSARSASVPKNKFQPSIIRGSAFGSAQPVYVPPGPESYDGDVDPPGSIRAPQYPIRNSKWTDAEVKMLIEGYARYGPRWESIRSYFPGLAHYSGLQLKDKHRHLRGR